MTELQPYQINRMGLSRSFQITNIFPRLSVFENVRCGLLWSMGYQNSFWRLVDTERALNERAAQILDEIGLLARCDLPAGVLAYAEQRALEIGITIAGGADVIMLDEPTAGVDIELRRQLWDYVKSLHDRGTTIVLTTHYLEEAEALCDRIAIINHGEVVANEPTPQLLSRISEKKLVVRPCTPLTEVPAGLVAARAELRPNGSLALAYNPAEQSVLEILEGVKAAGVAIEDLSTEESDLEDVFLQLTSSKAA